ncbi:MAG: glycine betaine ABC transporter substrate-binding protein [Trueperaceae bacterium]|jgi:glycine betaine/proline transport system substrate-binding protein
MKRLIVALSAVLAIGIASAQTDTIELGYVLWDSEIASTHVVAAVLIDELGYDVNMTSVDAGPMWTGLAQGDFDAIVAAWLPATHEAYWDQYGDSLVDLGMNLDGADIGWAVPAYVEIDSITQLNDNAAQFSGEIIGIDPGAGLMAASDRAMDVYGLSNLNLIDGSDAAMAAALDRAITRGDWIVVTSWRPHWMWAAYDLKYLEDPEGVFGTAEQIHTILSQEFADSGPADAIAFLDAFSWTGEDMGAVMLKILDGMEPFDAAREWLSENPDKVQEWLAN